MLTAVSGSRVRIVIQGVEVCGIIHDLATEFAAQGHVVTTIADGNRYFEYDYDYALSRHLHERDGPVRLPMQLGRHAARMLGGLLPKTYGFLSARLREKICLECDVYLQVWSGWPGEYRLLERLNRAGIKIVTLFMGSDVRHYPCFAQQYGEEDWDFPGSYLSGIEEKLLRLRMHERYSTAICSVPDQMGLALRPYFHLQVPVRVDEIRFNVPGRRRPLVVHAPTNTAIKGSDVIEAAVSKLADSGLEFDYLPLRGVAHDVLLDVLSVADVLVDQVLLHGPGWLGFEAMASGCAVATRYLESSPPVFRPPVLPIDRGNVEAALGRLLRDAELRSDLAHRGRKYVEEHNRVEDISRYLLRLAEGDYEGPDYVPGFLHDYRPKDESERRSIEKTLQIVQNQEWLNRPPRTAAADRAG